jgi:hypothetical protein
MPQNSHAAEWIPAVAVAGKIEANPRELWSVTLG